MRNLTVEMTLELRFPIKMAKLSLKKNRISFGKTNPMLKVSLVAGNVLNKRPFPTKKDRNIHSAF